MEAKLSWYSKNIYKFYKMPKTALLKSKAFEMFDEDEKLAILGSNNSWDAYEGHLFPMAKNKTVKEVILNYNKYFKPIYNEM